ncbi:uncharacterized protein LOC108115041 [Drosophila eugracilis]|uniref:uncharacterized protein LOC108115041 n=1 Tax=Drosophila eugracilis TaxID=29029 RepID=UPI0007E73A3B|nr:uncharacterized protein LOC108115041 [Drosophila eugracilis]
MKQFIVLMSLVAITAAAPQGYKYQPQGTALPIGNLRPQTPASTSGIYSGDTIPNLAQTGSQTHQSQPAVPIPPPLPIALHQQRVINVLPQQNLISSSQQVLQTQYVQRPAIVTKDIYIHSAPEETDEFLQEEQHLEKLPIRKNYRIVFIKAPFQNPKYTAAALKHAQSSNEEKTVIYVLSKKPDITEIQQQLQVSQSDVKVHKPEVYFIKYKTQEEAQRAQQEIQAQYDALGGATHITDEGVAPITSVSNDSFKIDSFAPQKSQAQAIIQTPPQHIVQFPALSQSAQQQSTGSFAPSVLARNYIPAKNFI